MTSIAEQFFRLAAERPEHCALWTEERAFSYGELGSYSARLANALHQQGVTRGDTIAVLLPNEANFVALMLAAADLGAILAPFHLSLPTDRIVAAAEAAGARHIVASSEQLAALSQLGVARLDGLWIASDGDSSRHAHIEALIDATVTDAPLLHGREEETYILTMTSGSTGRPKPIVLSQGAKQRRAEAARRLYGITAEDRTLAATPLYHSLAERLVLIPLLTGGTSILLSRFTPRIWLKCIHDQQVTFTIAVSSQLAQVARSITESDPPSIESLRCVVSSSARLDPKTKAELLARLDCEFHECYGASEIAIATNLDPRDAIDHIDSVGLPLPGVDVKILRKDGTAAATGEIGEIACATPMLFDGYYRQPEQTRAAMWGDYFRTGDLGHIDADGFVYYHGRTSELIISGGINIYPSDIEQVVGEVNGVSECAAFALPDERLGEIVAVAVVASTGASVTEREIRRHCGGRLADFQQPRRIYIVDELPRNALGKLTKGSLASQFGAPAQTDCIA